MQQGFTWEFHETVVEAVFNLPSLTALDCNQVHHISSLVEALAEAEPGRQPGLLVSHMLDADDCGSPHAALKLPDTAAAPAAVESGVHLAQRPMDCRRLWCTCCFSC